jgi:hypothetical protein
MTEVTVFKVKPRTLRMAVFDEGLGVRGVPIDACRYDGNSSADPLPNCATLTTGIGTGVSM